MGRKLSSFNQGELIVTHRRTLTESDIVNFAGITGDNNPVHMDEVTASSGPYGRRIVHGPMFVGLAFGLLSGMDVIDGTTIALKSIEWKFHRPVGVGDTVQLTAEVTGVSPHPSKTDRGDLSLGLTFHNQDDEVVSQGGAVVVLER